MTLVSVLMGLLPELDGQRVATTPAAPATVICNTKAWILELPLFEDVLERRPLHRCPLECRRTITALQQYAIPTAGAMVAPASDVQRVVELQDLHKRTEEAMVQTFGSVDKPVLPPRALLLGIQLAYVCIHAGIYTDM